MIKIKLNKQEIFTVKAEKSQVFVENKAVNWDLTQISANEFHVILNNKSYHIEVVEKNLKDKKIGLKINGKMILAEGKDELDLLLEEMGISEQKVKRIKDLKAPMPGLILKILVTEGQEVKKGDSLIILEAMKMENILKAQEDVVAGKVFVKTGEAVEKNQILLEFK